MKRIYLLNLILVSSILFPWIPSVATAPQLRPEWFVLIVGIAMFPVSRRALASKVALWTALTFLAYAVSLVYGFVVIGSAVDISDMTEMMKPLLYFLFFIFAASGRHTMAEYHGLLRIAIFSLVVAAVITLIQFFAPDRVAPLLRLWADDERIYSYELVRATGTLGNPNDLGFMMTIAFTLVLFTLESGLLPKRLSQALLLCCFAAVFATGSRTGMITLASVIIVYVYMGVKASKVIVVVAGALTFLAFWIFDEVLSHLVIAEGLVERVNTFSFLESDLPWQTRLELVSEMIPLIAESPVFGHGPAKMTFELGANIDNEYMLTLYRSGIIGLIATVGLVFALAMQYRRVVTSPRSLPRSMQQFAIASLVAAGLFAITAGIFLSFRLFGLLTVLWTVTAYVRSSGASENLDAPGDQPYFSGYMAAPGRP